jgi:5-methylcytosine-specific restriction enzyme subunit McrC
LGEVTIRLREWQSIAPDPDSPTHGRFLPQDPFTRSLTNSLSREGILDIQELRGGLHLKASSFVGFLSIGDLRIVIEPKIQGMQLMKLLRYAYGLRDLRLLTRVAPSIGEDSFLDLLIQQFLAECQEIIARGLHRRYEPVAARLATPRGRLDIQTLARNGIIGPELPCRYHPRVEDCLHNQVLLAGLRLAAEIACDRDLRSELRRTAPILENDVSRIGVSPATIESLQRQMNRLTVAYEPAISLIEILLDSSGVNLHGAPQEPRMPGFLFDMNRFFQRLLGRFLRENLPDHRVQEEKAIKGMMAYSPDYNPRACRAPAPRPDYCVKTKEGKTLLLDAKYRDLWSEDLPREMLYQLAIYALSQRPLGRATILYPTTNSAARDSVVRIYEPFSGSPRAEVVQRPVNLTRLAALLTSGPGIYEARQRREFALKLVVNPF